MNIFYQPLIPEGILHLDADESRHCLKVLRKSKGDTIRITDGRGFFYEAIIIDNNPASCGFVIEHKIKEAPKNHTLHIAISPTKNAERIEWFVEKAVEVGVDSITLLLCRHTERTFTKAERLEKVAISAMKQSLKATLPRISAVIPFSDVVEKSTETSRFIAHVDHTNPNHLKDIAKSGGQYLVLIGPEGDFSEEELHLALTNGFKKVSLGTSRLRTETAGLAACLTLNLINS
ncbi:MAG: 16S rRNA (uracil(1498)-N(3))-methyltransferase [Cyclobacteriaceae bacterium]|nr:16S rRNA (uracil(1498)-N(3))-methyltransferase [Cyclobacteriaceae bacterium]